MFFSLLLFCCCFLFFFCFLFFVVVVVVLFQTDSCSDFCIALDTQKKNKSSGFDFNREFSEVYK